MDKKNFNPELSGDLLGYHLGLADEQTRARVESAVDSPEALQATCDRLRSLLAPLDADRVEAPPNLAQRILDGVEQKTSTRAIPMSKAVALREADDREAASSPLLSLRELSGLAAAILIFAGIFIPGYRHAQQEARKAACANNLRAVGSGHVAYAEMYGGQLPFVGNARANVPWYKPGGRQSRHAYPMVKTGLVPVSAFVCPANEGDRVMNVEDPRALSDFPNIRNSSYCTPVRVRSWTRESLAPGFPIAADMTPLVDELRLIITTGTVPRNSRSHGQPGGQSVLRADSSVGYYVSPEVGLENDDIYRVVGVDEYTGFERPRLRSDAFLVP